MMRRISLIILGLSLVSASAAKAGSSSDSARGGLPHSASAAAAPAKATQTSDMQAQRFWADFAAAVARNDVQALQGMTHLPLRVRGEMDGDPVRKVGRQRLARTLSEVLDQPVYTTPPEGGALVRRPLRQVIAAMPELPVQAWLTPTTFRVEQLEFERLQGHWKLVLVYLP